jgi:hypothetical protein
MSQKIHRGLRLEPILSKRCEAKASEAQQTFSEWVRTILRREVGLEKKGRTT